MWQKLKKALFNYLKLIFQLIPGAQKPSSSARSNTRGNYPGTSSILVPIYVGHARMALYSCQHTVSKEDPQNLP